MADTLLQQQQQQQQPAPPQTPIQKRRIPRVGAAAASFAAAAASALIVCLAVSSSGQRAIIRGPNYSGGAPAHHQMALFPTATTTTTTTTEQTYSYPHQRRQMRRLEEMTEEDAVDVDQDMDERHQHHDDGGGDGTEEPLSEDAGQDSDADAEPELELELSTAVESIAEEDQIFRGQEMAERLRPRPMLSFAANATKQFAHLHHMKTGGTSINSMLRCALSRARQLYQEAQTPPDVEADADTVDGAHDGGRRTRTGQTLPFYSLEECSHSRYLSCINDNSTSAQSCRSSIASASVMQYCAPLHQMSRFDWLDADIVTVIRHPVDRVWSMFRFQTKSCFRCTPLLDIYRHIEEGTLDEFCGEKGCGGVCMPQLLNHETRNLLTDAWDENDSGGESLSTDEEKLSEALSNLNSRVTLVGVTDELPVFAEMLGKVFPWLAETVTAEGLGMAIEGDGASRRKLRRKTTANEPAACSLPHANASPKNNRCAPGNKHWDLPDEPDEETREAILRHNQLDLKIYEAAKARFQLQKKALGLQK